MASINATNLPAFFQSASKTVIDELADFELGGDLDDCPLDEEGLQAAPRDEEDDPLTFDEDTFGDLSATDLPDFFTQSAHLEPRVPPLSVVSSPPPPGLLSAPPGLTRPPSLLSSPPPAVSAPHYSTFFGSPTQVNTAAAPTQRFDQTNYLPLSNTSSSFPSTPMQYSTQEDPFVPQLLPMGIYHLSVTPTAAEVPSPAAKKGNVFDMFDLRPELLPPPSNKLSFSSQRPLIYRDSSNAYTSTSLPSNVPRPVKSTDMKYPRGKFMSPSDVRFVVNKVLQPMETNDPYADDFYFLQLNIKKNNAARERAVLEQRPLPSAIYVPLPVWKETKERIKLQIEATRQSFHQKSREWEEKEMVLGHQVRSNIHRPREQLFVPLLRDFDFDGPDQDDDDYMDGEFRTPFSSRLWTMRLAVQHGYEALYTVQELQHLLSSPLIASNQLAHAEIVKEIDVAIGLLSQSIGIRTNASSNSSAFSENFSLDGGHVGAILQTTIGKKLMSRTLKLLTLPYRWALVPVILAKILLSPPPENASTLSGAVSLAVEQRLLKTIVEFLQYSYQYQIEQQQRAAPGSTAPFTDLLIDNLRQCIKSVMVTQMEKNKLKQALISDRTRAEVMHMIVQIGDKVHVHASIKLCDEWVQTREAFMSMLE